MGASQLHPSRQVRWPPQFYTPAKAGFSTTSVDATGQRCRHGVEWPEALWCTASPTSSLAGAEAKPLDLAALAPSSRSGRCNSERQGTALTRCGWQPSGNPRYHHLPKARNGAVLPLRREAEVGASKALRQVHQHYKGKADRWRRRQGSLQTRAKTRRRLAFSVVKAWHLGWPGAVGAERHRIERHGGGSSITRAPMPGAGCRRGTADPTLPTANESPNSHLLVVVQKPLWFPHVFAHLQAG